MSRVRAMLVVVKAAVVAATAAVLVSSAAVTADAAPAPQTPASAPAPAPAKIATAPTATIAQLNTFLTSVKADGGTSVLLPDGRVLWLFGDQVNAAGNGFIGRNAAAIQTGASFSLLPGEFKPSKIVNGQAVWYWPGAAAIDAGQLVILWGEQTGDTSTFGSHGTGTVAVTYNASTLAVLSQTKTTAAKGGSSAVKVGSSWQVYGTRAVTGSYGKDVVRWTVPAGSLGKLGQYGSAVKVLDDTWGAGTDVAVAAEGTHLRLWTKKYDIVGSDIVTADNASGSWSAPTVLATTGPWTYAVHVHPEQTTTSITYAVNGNGAAQNGTYHLYAIAAQ